MKYKYFAASSFSNVTIYYFILYKYCKINVYEFSPAGYFNKVSVDSGEIFTEMKSW